MRLSKPFLFVTSLVVLCASLLRAQQTHQHDHQHDASEKLGQVSFPVTCTQAAQQQFNRAAALLHSFWYEEAEKAFTGV
ncbi:MAG: hypothetical protein L0312_03230, partial [Acidobacteria bacterium]|nr:hypothetical protein [Acidobacteriota bacterium]